MESEMGRVLTEVTIYNLYDLFEATRGTLPPKEVRKVNNPNAIVDSDASTLGFTPSVLQQLGVVKRGGKRTRTASSQTIVSLYEAVRIEIMGRDCTCDPFEVPEETPILIGQIPLETMDWVIDMKNHKLIGNPAHDGEHIIEMY